MFMHTATQHEGTAIISQPVDRDQSQIVAP